MRAGRDAAFIAADAPSIESLETPMRRAVAPILIGFAALGIYAALELRGLYADGAAYLLQMMERGDFFLPSAPRRVTHLLQQLPVVMAMRLGVGDPEPLGQVFGLAMYLVPLALVAACYALLPRGKKAYFLFPLFHYLAGSQAAGFVGVVEAPLASAYFWFLLFLIVFHRRTPWLLAPAAVPAIYLHEAFLFLGPVLAVAAAWRGRTERASGTRAVCWALALWFLLIAGVQLFEVLTVRDPSSRDGFLSVMVTLGFLFDLGGGFGHGGVNVPALAGVAAGVAAWLAVRRASWTTAIVAGFAMTTTALVAATAICDACFAPAMQFDARGYGAILSLPLSTLFLLSLWRPAWIRLWARPAVVSIMLVLAAGQLGWQALGTWYWSRYVETFRSVLGTHRGLVPWPEAVASLPPDRAYLLWRLSWYWTNPSLSMVLSPRGKVGAMIDNPIQVTWQPFDPADPNEVPAGPRFDVSGYLAALMEARKAAP